MATVIDGKLDETFAGTANGADVISIGGSFTCGVRGTFVGTVFLERDIRGDGQYSTVYAFTTPEERNGREVAQNINYRWRAAVTSGSAIASLRAGRTILDVR